METCNWVLLRLPKSSNVLIQNGSLWWTGASGEAGRRLWRRLCLKLMCCILYLSSFMGVESISVAIETLTPCRYKVKRKLDNRRTDRKTKLFGLVPKFTQTNLVWFQTCKAPKGFVSVNSISVISWYKHITVTAKLKWRNLRMVALRWKPWKGYTWFVTLFHMNAAAIR